MSDRVAGLAIRRSRAVLMVAALALALALMSVMGTGTYANAKGQPESNPTAAAVYPYNLELSTGGLEHPWDVSIDPAAKTVAFNRGEFRSFAVDDWIAGRGQHPSWAIIRVNDFEGTPVRAYRYVNPLVTKVELGGGGAMRVTAKYQSLEIS
ncbi:hypothetical protein [Streptomyces sp. NPDC059092]|uniref:hypothetical protein n=1 Tax=Streptomyces sp. NPDC059092 TaxID=3346725 RepID=UPI0036C26D6B